MAAQPRRSRDRQGAGRRRAPSGHCFRAFRYWRSFISRRPLVTVSRISPQANSTSAETVSPVARIAVGKRGTKPVSRNVVKIGYASTSDVMSRIRLQIEKNTNGCSFFERVKMVQRMRVPSLYLFNLLDEPSGRSL